MNLRSRPAMCFFAALAVVLTGLPTSAARARAVQPGQSTAIWPAGRPKLVVVVAIDQFRADYLSRFGSKFSANGFRRLLQNGSYYPYGEYDILQSMTGPGHATILSGSYPYQMGIPLNDWYDQKSHALHYCVEDEQFKTVGAPAKQHVGTSPNQFIGTTIGDELKNAGLKTRNISLALKDRAAILMGGHRADLAFWFDGESKRWVSSQYYLKTGELPKWIDELNDKKLAQCDLSEPCGIDLTAQAFLAAVKNEKLGASGRDVDLISVSFSSHDYAGHKFGPNAPELEIMTLAEDRALATMTDALAKSVPGGLKNVLFVLTGDHGVAPSPEYLQETGIPTGQIDESALITEMTAALNQDCGQKNQTSSGKWIEFVEDFNFFLNEQKVRASSCDLPTVENKIKQVLLKTTGFSYVLTQDEYEHRKLPPAMLGRQTEKTYFPGRSGHVIAIVRPFYINRSKNHANHMTGYSYDRTVPLLFSGYGIKAGLHADHAEIIDIAPTLAFILGIIPPALSEGHVLKESLKTGPF
jgi:predicted AlkP superfamily pyrophosphatase or phosphodiesterase